MSFLFLVYDNKGLTAYYRIDTGFGQGDFGVLGGKKRRITHRFYH